MAFLTRHGKIKTGALVFTMVFLIFPTILIASDTVELQTLETKKLTLVSGKSIVLRSIEPISRVSIAAPEVADFLILSANESSFILAFSTWISRIFTSISFIASGVICEICGLKPKGLILASRQP